MTDEDSREEGRSAAMIRVLIVDDHPIMRAGIASVLADQPDMLVIGEATDGAEAMDLTASLGPDVTLMDIQMPGGDGIEAIRSIISRVPQARIIVLTTYPRQALIARALDAGASGFLTKTSLRTTMIEAIRTVHSGGRYLSPDDPTMSHHDQGLLSEREIEILNHIAAGRTNKEIGIRLGLSTDTIKVALKTLFQKLKVEDRTQAVMTAARRGFIDAGQ